MKTIFITSFHTLISRNILGTDLLSRLSREHRLVILVPDYKRDYFFKHFGGSNILVHGVPSDLSARDLIFRRLSLALSPSKTLAIKRRSDFYERKTWFSFLAFILPLFLLGRIPFCIRLFRYLDYHWPGRTIFRKALRNYEPSLIFGTDLQNELDVKLLQEARKSGIKTIGMVRSWDNLTAKGLLRFIPDRLVVQNQIIKKEAVRYNRVSAEKITVVGLPHYDKYLKALKGQDNLIKNRNEFFRGLGLDPAKKAILFAPAGRRYIDKNETDKYVLEILSELDLNILVRIPPGDSANFEGFKSRRAKVVFDYSGVSFWKGGRKTNELSREDDDRLINSLYWSNVVVAHLATMCIDAAFFDKPTIVIAFDKDQRPYWDSIRRYFDYEHLEPVVKSEGIKVARSAEELIPAVAVYFRNPKLDGEGRERIVEDEIGFRDGQSTERLANVLLSYL